MSGRAFHIEASTFDPVFNGEIGNAAELAFIVGDEGDTGSHSVSGDPEIVVADRTSSFFPEPRGFRRRLVRRRSRAVPQEYPESAP